MDNSFKNFYRKFYLSTSGFLPAKPLVNNMFPGDFFQIRNGEIVMLGNIFRHNIIDRDRCKFSYGIKLNPSGWHLSEGLSKPYSGRSTGQGSIEGEFEFSRQLLSFSQRGSFFFKGREPESVKIVNWNELQQELIIKFTQTLYSFRELYLVTECATTSDWALAISGAEKAELEIATNSDNFGLVDIFGHHEAKTIQSRDIEYYHREHKRKPCFFKAKKLIVQDNKLDVFINELITARENQNQWAGDFYDYDFHYDDSYSTDVPACARGSLLDMLPANELNPNTALLYFKWADANLDDVEKLFTPYGY